MSLSEAEAVIGLIDAENEESLALNVSHTQGVLKTRCDSIYSSILHLLSSVYVKIDYPEEDLAEVSDSEFIAEMKRIHADLCDLESTYKHGKAVTQGVKTALIGKPNTGKSSILNALAGENKAIVTDIEGTTRDVIEEKINAGRIILRLFDTAGIRNSSDAVEKIGIDRALEKAREAELVIGVLDTSRPLDEQDGTVIEILKDTLEKGKCVILALNKSDENAKFSEADVKKLFTGFEATLKTVVCSARTGEGVDGIKTAAEGFFCDGEIDYQGTAIVASARQHSAVCAAKNALTGAIEAFEASMSADVCGLDLEAALAAIGQVDGRTVSGEITDAIFHNFCVGK
jgi:tRNA modification GTPase